ncbi:hypothetical protein Dimus_015534 [Dionaea muscipula]
MNDNGLSNVMSLIKKQKWENLFKRRELMHTAACKEFYANSTVFIYKKKEIARSRVKGVEIEFDSMKLSSILDVPGHTVMKNVVPRFGKRDTSFMDLTYMDHLVSGRKINLPRVMMRHMAYVISVKSHELLYGDWMTMIFDAFGVPLVDKKGEEPKRYDYFEETFLTMCKLIRKNGIWWIGTGENRRRDDEIEPPAEEEVIIDEATDQGESGSGEKFYDAEDEIQESAAVVEEVPTVAAHDSAQQKETEAAGVDPLGPSGHIPESVMIKLQAEFERARANRIQADLEKAQAENARLLALLQQAKNPPKP